MLGRAPLVIAFFLVLAEGIHAGVVINEIHYDPALPGGASLEFVELHNSTATAVELAGWRFVDGISFTFPGAAVIAPGGLVVVARDRPSLIAEFGIEPGQVFGNFVDSLDNGGEELVLVDQSNAVIDAVRYDDDLPWSSVADEGETSLQRLCADGFSHTPENWSAVRGDRPTPLAPNVRTQCPPPERPAAAIAISEVHYHPAFDRDALEEFVELYNPGDARVSLGGWKLDLGKETFELGAEVAIEAGEYLAICRNAQHVRDHFGIQNAVGDFTGDLSNRNGRIILYDPNETWVDVVAYRDETPWPSAADGAGSSLERIVLLAPGDDPRNWASSDFRSNGEEPFVHVEVFGSAADRSSQTVIFAIDGAGEYIIDNVVLESVEDESVRIELDFESEEDDALWTPRGNASASAFTEGVGVGGSRALHLVSSSHCRGDRCPARESISMRVTASRDLNFLLSFDCRHLAGSTRLDAGLLAGLRADVERALPTPGQENSQHALVAPPTFSYRGRFPQEPTSEDAVFLSTRVRTSSGGAMAGSEVERVQVTTLADGVDGTVAMWDDGLHHDGLPGDGTYGAELPAFPHNTQVFYRFAAISTAGVTGFSPQTRGDVPSTTEFWGFYVNDNQPDSTLPVYDILLPGLDPTDPEAINEFFDPGGLFGCGNERLGAFAFEGELYSNIDLRFRGNTACVVKKRNLKLDFNRGRFFRGLNKMNLQGLWTDKSLVREHLAWDFFRDIGAAYAETEFVRVHVNGEYHGLFLRLEHPDRNFLRRNGLDDDGAVYKANQPPFDPFVPGVARVADFDGRVVSLDQLFEKETLEHEPFDDLEVFLDDLHADGRNAPGPSVQFMADRVKIDMVMRFQLGQVVMNNLDSGLKNHFLYRDARDDRFGMISWDMDLGLGKFFDSDLPERQPAIRVGTLNDCLRSPSPRLVATSSINEVIQNDLNPWLHTGVRNNLVFNFFPHFLLTAGDGFFQRAYLIRLHDILNEKYSSAVMDPQIDDIADILDDEAREDRLRWGRYEPTADCREPNATSELMEVQIGIIKNQLSLHRQFLLDYIKTFEDPTIPDHPRLKITEIFYNAPGSAKEETLEFVELLNTTGRQIDVSGWQLTGGIEFRFPDGTNVDAGGIVVVTNSKVDFDREFSDTPAEALVLGNYEGRLSNDGEELRLVDAGPGHPATIDIVVYSDRDPWPETRDGESIAVVGISSTLDNDQPHVWQVPTVGATPGVVTTLFIRGDANGDNDVALSDSVFILNHLFRGGDNPNCDDAADVDDDGRVRLNDAVIVLRYLFLNDSPPRLPFPEPGTDPTIDGLSCF